MFLRNSNRLITDVPAKLELDCYEQAIEVFSISKQLMDLDGYDNYDLKRAMLIREDIFKRWDNVITDEEYIEKRDKKEAKPKAKKK